MLFFSRSLSFFVFISIVIDTGLLLVYVAGCAPVEVKKVHCSADGILPEKYKLGRKEDGGITVLADIFVSRPEYRQDILCGRGYDTLITEQMQCNRVGPDSNAFPQVIIQKLTVCRSQLAPMRANADWMAELPYSMKHRDIRHLAIPGSHNTFAYEIFPEAGFAINAMPFDVPSMRLKRDWSIAQSMDITQQLMAGIRYFDARITMDRTGRLVFHHTYIGLDVLPALRDIRRFLLRHKSEVVIFHAHNEALGTIGWPKLCNAMQKVFGDLLYTNAKFRDVDFSHDMTLEYLYRLDKRIIFIRDRKSGSILKHPSSRCKGDVVIPGFILESALGRQDTEGGVTASLENFLNGYDLRNYNFLVMPSHVRIGPEVWRRGLGNALFGPMRGVRNNALSLKEVGYSMNQKLISYYYHRLAKDLERGYNSMRISKWDNCQDKELIDAYIQFNYATDVPRFMKRARSLDMNTLIENTVKVEEKYYFKKPWDHYIRTYPELLGNRTKGFFSTGYEELDNG